MKTDNITYEPKDSPLVGTLITDDDGVQMKVADMQTWTETLKKAYPDGLVIKMPDESLAHLLDLKEALEEGREHLLDEVTFAGQIDKENPHIIPEGELKTELRLPTEMYYRITPDEMRYPLDAPEAEWMKWEDRACTRLLHEHQDNLQGAYVEVTIREEVMPFLHIEGQPYQKVMDVIERTGVTTESDLKQLLKFDRITDTCLYGKVDNVHVRCKIDGVQQMGRPITPEDAKRYAGWKEDARLLGKDTLNYKTWLHEDYIKQIAANAFSDVLNRATGQEKQQSMKR